MPAVPACSEARLQTRDLGFSPTDVYSTTDIDRVDLFNGNVPLTPPLDQCRTGCWSRLPGQALNVAPPARVCAHGQSTLPRFWGKELWPWSYVSAVDWV